MPVWIFGRIWPHFFKIALGAAVLAALGGCDALEQGGKPAPTAAQQAAKTGHDIYRSLPAWKSNMYRSAELMAEANPGNTSIQIDVADQRGLLLVDGAIAMDFPVATGRADHPTPQGTFYIKAKEKDYASNIYGKIYDAQGRLVVADADTKVDPVPPGGRFVGALMLYWMRLTDDGVGMHIGYVPGVAASHGCIRMKEKTAAEIFAVTRVGTPVLIAEHAPALR